MISGGRRAVPSLHIFGALNFSSFENWIRFLQAVLVLIVKTFFCLLFFCGVSSNYSLKVGAKVQPKFRLVKFFAKAD